MTIDVLELDKPNDNALGRELRVGGSAKYRYTDLDELIYSHIRAMANKVEEMIAHEKFKGSEEDMRKSSCDLLPTILKTYAVTYMRNYQMANPDRPVYAFCVDRKRAGQFKLTFITAKGQAPVSWVSLLSTISAALLMSCVSLCESHLVASSCRKKRILPT